MVSKNQFFLNLAKINKILLRKAMYLVYQYSNYYGTRTIVD